MLWLTFDLCLHAANSVQDIAEAPPYLNKKYIWEHFAWKDKQLTCFFSFLFLNTVSGYATTTSSAVKPLGAGLYWKPVALTKNPTVLFGAEPLASDKLHTDTELTPELQVRVTHSPSSQLHPVAAS